MGLAMGSSDRQDTDSARPISLCPWCGSSAQLALRGDGMGAVAMHCDGCGASGPAAALSEGFDAADERATALWGARRAAGPIAPDTLARVGTAMRLHRLIQPRDSGAMVGVAWRDLDLLVRSATCAEAPRG